MGGYLSQDPIRLFSGEPNFYAYVDDTNSWVDIFGLKKKSTGRKPIYNDIKSTGRTIPKNKNEAFAFDFVEKHPENGTKIIDSSKINDKAFKNYNKMSQTVNGVEVHYMAKIDGKGNMTEVSDFKIKGGCKC